MPHNESRIDVAVVGGGLSGMTAAALLQNAGIGTVVFESHATPGGCAGYFRRDGFSFDVGATTLVDFEVGGVGGRLLRELQYDVEMKSLPGYRAWLPDRSVAPHRDNEKWRTERLALGRTPAHLRFWRTLDQIAHVFGSVNRRGGRMPLRGLSDVSRNTRALHPRDVAYLRYVRWSARDLLQPHDRLGDRELCGLLSMIVEDTVHTSFENAPLVHAALGFTMRGAGRSRAKGGMFISASDPDDHASAPPRWQSVMINTHCGLDGWRGMDPTRDTHMLAERLIQLARRSYPRLGSMRRVFEVGSPATYCTAPQTGPRSLIRRAS